MRSKIVALLVAIAFASALDCSAITIKQDWSYDETSPTCFIEMSIDGTCFATGDGITVVFDFGATPPCDQNGGCSQKTVTVVSALLVRYKHSSQGALGTPLIRDTTFNITGSFAAVTNNLLNDVMFTCPQMPANILGNGQAQDFVFTMELRLLASHICPGTTCGCARGPHNISESIEVQYWHASTCDRTVGYNIEHDHQPCGGYLYMNPACTAEFEGSLTFNEAAFLPYRHFENTLAGAHGHVQGPLPWSELLECPSADWGNPPPKPLPGDPLPADVPVSGMFPSVEAAVGGCGIVRDGFGEIPSSVFHVSPGHTISGAHWHWDPEPPPELSPSWVMMMDCGF
ncbi:MAG: hypothetical protein WC712_00630 [Candidatus Brocadiia bacterium]